MPNLYLLESIEYLGDNAYESAVVCAESEEEAARIHPDGQNRPETWVSKASEINITLIGIADKQYNPGTVVCASFYPG